MASRSSDRQTRRAPHSRKRTCLSVSAMTTSRVGPSSGSWLASATSGCPSAVPSPARSTAGSGSTVRRSARTNPTSARTSTLGTRRQRFTSPPAPTSRRRKSTLTTASTRTTPTPSILTPTRPTRARLGPPPPGAGRRPCRSRSSRTTPSRWLPRSPTCRLATRILRSSSTRTRRSSPWRRPSSPLSSASSRPPRPHQTITRKGLRPPR
mmetsp:Transcript_15533/g.31686  ORF Transcript_15533/g.31686 Transcript_15533/m.31686 type:complete len:209 (+) Transcript_15533:353-979(+)